MMTYTPRFYPIGVRGGKWVKMWNDPVAKQCTEYIRELAHIEMEERIRKLWTGGR
jgi:hypothetical protein